MPPRPGQQTCRCGVRWRRGQHPMTFLLLVPPCRPVEPLPLRGGAGMSRPGAWLPGQLLVKGRAPPVQAHHLTRHPQVFFSGKGFQPMVAYASERPPDWSPLRTQAIGRGAAAGTLWPCRLSAPRAGGAARPVLQQLPRQVASACWRRFGATPAHRSAGARFSALMVRRPARGPPGTLVLALHNLAACSAGCSGEHPGAARRGL